MTDYDDYDRQEYYRDLDRREDFNREMDRDYENFQEDLKFQHEEAEETSKLAGSLIESGNAKAAAALYGFNITDDAPVADTAAPDATESLESAIAYANVERQRLIDSVNARMDLDYFTRMEILSKLASFDVTSQADIEDWRSFVNGLLPGNMEIWLALQSFTQAVNRLR